MVVWYSKPGDSSRAVADYALLIRPTSCSRCGLNGRMPKDVFGRAVPTLWPVCPNTVCSSDGGGGVKRVGRNSEAYCADPVRMNWRNTLRYSALRTVLAALAPIQPRTTPHHLPPTTTAASSSP